MDPLFGQRLKAARLMAGLSMDALVAKSHNAISKQAISKYERGLMAPDSRILLALCDALSIQPDYLYSRTDLPLEAVDFRKKASLGSKATEAIKARVKDSLERYSELESFLPTTTLPFQRLPSPVIQNHQDIEAAVLAVREAWHIGSESPVASVIDLLEEHGIKVLELDAPDGFDGLSGWAGQAPFIVLAKAAPSDRKRLTALHEFAHLSLVFADTLPSNAREKLCHAFGSAFLLPNAALVKELGSHRTAISFVELRNLKRQYGISMQAIMYRARVHMIISESTYESFTKTMSARGWRKEEPEPCPFVEIPQRFEQLLHRAISEDLISLSKAAYLANTTITALHEARLLHDAHPHP